VESGRATLLEFFAAAAGAGIVAADLVAADDGLLRGEGPRGSLAIGPGITLQDIREGVQLPQAEI